MKTPKWMAVIELLFAIFLLTFVTGAIFLTDDCDRSKTVSINED
jgi:hypothetical protein